MVFHPDEVGLGDEVEVWVWIWYELKRSVDWVGVTSWSLSVIWVMGGERCIE